VKRELFDAAGGPNTPGPEEVNVTSSPITVSYRECIGRGDRLAGEVSCGDWEENVSGDGAASILGSVRMFGEGDSWIGFRPFNEGIRASPTWYSEDLTGPLGPDNDGMPGEGADISRGDSARPASEGLLAEFD